MSLIEGLEMTVPQVGGGAGLLGLPREEVRPLFCLEGL